MTNKTKHKHHTKKNKNHGSHNSQGRVHKSVHYLVTGIWIFIGIVLGLIIVFGNRNEFPRGSGVYWKVLEAKFDERGTYPFTAPYDGKFVVVNLKIKNQSKSTFAFAPVIQTRLKDTANGKTFTMSPATLKNPIQAGPIKSGQEVEGQLSYIVDNDSNKLEYIFSIGNGYSTQSQKLEFK